MSTPPILGIDLGTTNSSVAIFAEGAVRMLPNALGDVLTPSVVAWDERAQELVVGRTAKDIYALHPDRAAALFKRGMGSDTRYTVGPDRYSAVELSALVLKALRADAERDLGLSVERAVITVPAYFNDAQRYATMQAGELAGLDVVRIINEPTAAAIAHGLHNKASDGTILVFDLGGGTFDVCVMDRFDGTLEVRSVAGESMLGGEDFTRRIAGESLQRCGLHLEWVEMSAPELLGSLLKRAELLKRRLADVEEGTLDVPAVPPRLAEGRTLTLTRAEVEEACASLLDRLRRPCREALRGAHLSRQDLDEIILVGGATRMPAVRAFVDRIFEHEILSGVDPDLAVVHGAAIQAALCNDDAAVSDMVVTDVASHSLGTDIAKDFGAREVGGFFAPVIHRNTVIPTSVSQIFVTRHDNQTQIDFDIYEGESRHVRDNRLIGGLKVTDIPRGPAGQQVEARFTYDLNGILEVEITVLATGRKVSKVFHRNAETLTPEQLEVAARRIERLKQDPREAPRVRDAIARAELLIQEADPSSRGHLEAALDALEDALARRDPQAIEASLQELLSRCRDLDEDERW